jgi:hypothetical protein
MIIDEAWMYAEAQRRLEPFEEDESQPVVYSDDGPEDDL